MKDSRLIRKVAQTPQKAASTIMTYALAKVPAAYASRAAYRCRKTPAVRIHGKGSTVLVASKGDRHRRATELATKPRLSTTFRSMTTSSV